MKIIDDYGSVPPDVWMKGMPTIDAKQQRVRMAINEALMQFVGRPMDEQLRNEMRDKALEIGRLSSKQHGIRPPKVFIDRDPKDPRRVAVRITFPLGGRL